MRTLRFCLIAAVTSVSLTGLAHAQQGYHSKQNEKHDFAYDENEPIAKQVSLAKSAEYLDAVADFWMKDKPPNKGLGQPRHLFACGACHANFAFVMARPLINDHGAMMRETRDFLEKRFSWPKSFLGNTEFLPGGEAVSIAFALAWNDAHTTGKLQDSTRKALARMWKEQNPSGGWSKFGCGSFPPPENDAYFPSVLAALAVGIAPQDYARSAEAKDGLTRLRRFLVKTPPPDLHHRAMLLWASGHLDGLITSDERAESIKALLAKQNQDGGWSLGSLRPSRARTFENDKWIVNSESDGYGTAFAVYVLRQAGVPAARAELVKGVNWLTKNQRVSGRWFTPCPEAGAETEGGLGARDLYLQNLGTAFAVLALKSCETKQVQTRSD
jgi:squalene-hopene/tetraprenyl-beta-curcumene cyclase